MNINKTMTNCTQCKQSNTKHMMFYLMIYYIVLNVV